MTGDREDDVMAETALPARRARGRLVRTLIGIALVAAGVAGGVLWSERRAVKGPGESAPRRVADSGGESRSAPAPFDAARSDEPVEVSLTPEAIARAGIKTVTLRAESATAMMTVPATVTSNAYRDTKVNSLVGGIVRQVTAELGSAIKRGQTLAVVFSTDLAEAQMKYLSMQATLTADHQKLARTDKLVTLGAASRQELEDVTAMRTGHATEVAAARQRLLLLGLSPRQVEALSDASHIVSEVTVPAPADGVVIARSVNPGQVVGAGQELFVVTDLATVWVIGDLYEKDFATVRVGSDATVGIPSAPNRARPGRIAYIDPRVDPATRTAKVRVEVANPDTDLRLGMYVTLAFRTSSGERLTFVPRDAVQSIGDRSVVYVSVEDGEGRFVERPVKLGQTAGDSVQVLEGVKPGEKVVTAGSFFLRAEAARTRPGG
jgi:RND family efflux transporter MFP subunit